MHNSEVIFFCTRFRRLALQYHPDKNTDTGADEMFAAVCESFDALDDGIFALVSCYIFSWLLI